MERKIYTGISLIVLIGLFSGLAASQPIEVQEEPNHTEEVKEEVEQKVNQRTEELERASGDSHRNSGFLSSFLKLFFL